MAVTAVAKMTALYNIAIAFARFAQHATAFIPGIPAWEVLPY